MRRKSKWPVRQWQFQADFTLYLHKLSSTKNFRFVIQRSLVSNTCRLRRTPSKRHLQSEANPPHFSHNQNHCILSFFLHNDSESSNCYFTVCHKLCAPVATAPHSWFMWISFAAIKKTSDSMIVVVVLLMMAGDAGWALFGWWRIAGGDQWECPLRWEKASVCVLSLCFSDLDSACATRNGCTN